MSRPEKIKKINWL